MGEAFRKQHIVPKVYLKRFAVKSGKHYVIGTRLCKDNKPPVSFFQSEISDVGYRKNIYDTTEQDDPKYWEHYLNKEFETLYDAPLERIISKIALASKNTEILDTADIQILSKIVFSQIVRVPDYLEPQINLSRATADSYKESIFKEFPNLNNNIKQRIKQKYSTDNELKNFVLDGTFNPQRVSTYCDVLYNKTWIVLYNGIRESTPFVTSDNPVLLLDSAKNVVKLTEIGLISEKLIIYFPITPSILIGIYPKSMFLNSIKVCDKKMFILNENDKEFIDAVNQKIMTQSYIHSFIPEPLFSMMKG